MRKYIFTLGALFLCLQLFCSMNRVQAQCADGLGQIAFTGYQIADNSNPQGQEDQFSFILLDSLHANTKIYFTDLGLVSAISFQTTTQAKTDGVLIWSNPIGLSPGTHIVVKVLSQTANLGSVTKGDGNFELGLGGDQLFACMGSLAPATIEAALLINKANWDSSVPELSSSKSVAPNLDPNKKQLAIVSNNSEDAFQATWKNTPALTGSRQQLRQQITNQPFTIFSSLAVDEAKLSVPTFNWNPAVPTKSQITIINNLVSIVSDACYYQWQVSSDGILYTDILDNAKASYMTVIPNPTIAVWYRVKLMGAKTIYSDPIRLGPLSSAPVIRNLTGDHVRFIEGASPVLLDLSGNAEVTDSDSDDFDTGSLRVAIVRNLKEAEDVLLINNQGTAAGEIGVSGNNVTYEGIVVGTFSGGTQAADLLVTFNENATPAVAQQLIRNIQYHNTDRQDPSTLAREVSFILTDGDGGTSFPNLVNVMVFGVNDAPTFNVRVLNPTFTEKGPAVELFSNTLINTVEAGQKIIMIKLSVSNVADTDAEYMLIDGIQVNLTKAASLITITNQINLTVAYDVSLKTTTLMLSKTTGLTAALWMTLIDKLSYDNRSANPTDATRVVILRNIQDDGGSENGGADLTSFTITSAIRVVTVNDPPQMIAPVGYILNEDTELLMTGISFSDADAAELTVTFTSTNGTFKPNSSAGISWIGAGTNELIGTGTLASLNDMARNAPVSFKPMENFNGQASATVVLNDNGNTGPGAPQTKSLSIPLTIIAINDEPVITVPDAQSMTQDGTLNFTNNTRITVSDVDAGMGILRVTLNTENGKFSLSSTDGLNFIEGHGLMSTNSVFEGSLRAINNALKLLVFTPNAGYSGPAKLSILVDDKGNTGEGGPIEVGRVIDISVQPKAATVLDVSAVSAAGLYKIGSELTLKVKFDRLVAVIGGAATLQLGTGLVNRLATYVSGSGTDELIFYYVVQAGDQSADLDYSSSTALALNGGKIQDADGIDASLILPTPGAETSLSGTSALVIDGVVPAFTFTINGAAAFTNTLDVTVAIQSNDTDLQRMDFSNTYNAGWVDLGSYVHTKSWKLGLGDGKKIVYVRLVDHAGNTTIAQASIILDMTVPIVSGVSNDGIYNMDLTITFNEGTATLNGAAFTSGTKVSAEGDYTLVVTDAASNVTNVSFKIDKTAPVVHGVYNEGIFNTDPIISFNEGTALLNGNPFTSGTRVSKEGNYTLVVTDAAGNIITLSFVIDKTAPGKPADLQALAGNQQVELSWSENTELDFEYYAISYSSSTIPKTLWKNVSTATPNPIKDMLDNGVDYTFYVKAIDKAGNASAEATIIATPKDAQTISFAAPTGLRYGMADLSLLATASSGLAVTYKSSDIGIALPYRDLADAGKWKLKILNAGPFVLTAMQVGNNAYSEALEVNHRLEIAKADLSSISLANQSYTYDGISKELLVSGILPTGVTVAYTGNNQTNAGVYAVEANLIGGTNYENKSLQASLTIAKAEITGISLANQSYTYDGTSKELLVAGTLPTGVTVNYTGNKQTNAGVYPIEANLIGGTNYENKSLQASLTISKAAITGISLANKSYTYDGTSKELLVSGTLPTGVTLTYTGNKQTNAGVYAVVASLDGGSNYEGQTLNANLTIAKASLNHLRLNDAQFVYDAQVKSLQIKGALPEGLVIRYSNNEQINAGIYTVTAEVKPTQNYDGLNLSARLEILQATQQIDFPAVSDLYRDAGTVDLKVQASSGLPVQLLIDEPTIAQLSGLSLSVLRLGTVVVTATQAGDSNYEAATAVAQRIRIVADAGAALPIRVHQALSPNGDGINDFFMIEGILDYPENKVTIFDKAGKVIQIIESYNNRDRVFTGEYILNGTYYYYIDVKDGKKWKREKGFFVIKRTSTN